MTRLQKAGVVTVMALVTWGLGGLLGWYFS